MTRALALAAILLAVLAAVTTGIPPLVASTRAISTAPGRATQDRPPGALCLAAALLAPSAPLAPACTPATPVADWLPYAPADAEATRDPRPIQTAFSEWTSTAATARAVELATYYATTYTPTLTVTTTPTIEPTIDATIERTVGTYTQVPTVSHTPTPVLFACRFTPTRCGTRAWLPFGGKGRRR